MNVVTNHELMRYLTIYVQDTDKIINQSKATQESKELEKSMRNETCKLLKQLINSMVPVK